MEDEENLSKEEEDMDVLEDEIKDEEVKTKKPKNPEVGEEQANETYEGFMQPARLGIMNTVSGEIIEGFEIGKDEGIVQLGKALLNKLDKIAIASGV